jgi:hypothetical protein
VEDFMSFFGMGIGLIVGYFLGTFSFSQVQLIRTFGKKLVDKLGDGGFLTVDRSVLIRRYRNTEIICYSIVGIAALVLAIFFAREVFLSYLVGLFVSLFSVRIPTGFTTTNLRDFIVINRPYLDLSSVGEDDEPIIVALKVELEEIDKKLEQ